VQSVLYGEQIGRLERGAFYRKRFGLISQCETEHVSDFNQISPELRIEMGRGPANGTLAAEHKATRVAGSKCVVDGSQSGSVKRQGWRTHAGIYRRLFFAQPVFDTKVVFEREDKSSPGVLGAIGESNQLPVFARLEPYQLWWTSTSTSPLFCVYEKVRRSSRKHQGFPDADGFAGLHEEMCVGRISPVPVRVSLGSCVQIADVLVMQRDGIPVFADEESTQRDDRG